jgi:methyl-accepting chemotaxis protein
MLAAINDWQLSKKMLAAFGVMAVLFVTLGIDAVTTNRSLTDIARKQVSQGLAGESALSDVLNEIREQRIIVYSYHNAVERKDEKKLEERLVKSRAALMAAIDVYAPIGGAAFAAQTQDLRNAVERLTAVNDRIFAAHRASQGADADALKLIKGDGKEASHDAIDAADLLKKMGRERSDAANVDGLAVARRALLLTLGLMTASLGMLAGIWWLISRTVARPMAELADATTTLADGGAARVPHLGRNDELGAIAHAVEGFRVAAASRAEADARVATEQKAVTATLGEAMSSLSAGDLTAEIHADFPPVYASLKTSFNSALSDLRALIGSVMESAATIRTGSEEIAQASEDLARRTEGNAASLEETSAAVHQIEGRLRATAEAAGRTVTRADQAIATVGSGRSIAGHAVTAMGRVSDSAKGIDDVIEGLDKIAFQTRVLAMNAAVEAGRAGEAGRGFAVVADLVSALAMRAEEEAKRARDQLTVTQAEIGTAVGAVQKVDGAFSEISEDVGEVHALLNGMASDNQAQSAAIGEISTAIANLDQATQQNAAMVEETSAAARNLTDEVEKMAEQAGKFTVTDKAARRAASRMVAPGSLRPVDAGARARGGAPLPGEPMRRPRMNTTSGAAAANEWVSF